MNSAHDSAKILIVDADALILTGVAAILDQAGYICYCARDAQAAMKAVALHAPELIVCDTHLGTECGLTLIAEIRRDAAMSDVSVLFVSSSSDPLMIDKTRGVGGSFYLRKPFDPWVLMELVDKALWMPALINTKVDRGSVSPMSMPRMAMGNAMSGKRSMSGK